MLTMELFSAQNKGMEDEKSTNTGKELTDVLTINQAAKEAGVTGAAVRNAIYAGKLQKTEMLERIVIERAEFERWRAATKMGRPIGTTKKAKAEKQDAEPGETQH